MQRMPVLRPQPGRLALPVVVVLVFVAGFAFGSQFTIGLAQSQFAQPSGTDTLFAPFWQVYNLIEDEYVDPEGDPLDTRVLVDGAIAGMVEALDDQFSGYMDAETFPLINQELEGSINGIGVVIRTVEDTGEIEIVSVMEGSPALAAGLQAGDIFMAVDGEDVSAMNQTELAQRVRGLEGTTLELTIRRGDELIDFTITRARIEIPMVESELLDGDIAYIQLNQFGPDARAEIDRALATLAPRDALEGLVLDLRGNPGGLLSAAIDVGSAFVPQGTLLIEDFGGGQEQPLMSNGRYAGIEVPIAVLVDEGSASAAELLAGALQDHGRATIIGERTFGKGTVQTWQQLVNGGGLRLTIARWLTPDRHWIHHEGITPDIAVEWNPTTYDREDDVQLDAALDFLQAEIAAQAQ